MQRQEIGDRADLVEREQLDAHALGNLLRDERIVRHHPHAERPGARRHLLTDASESGDAERLAPQLGSEEPLLLPLALLHGPVGGRHGARQRQHQRARMLGDADAVGARRVDDQNAAGAGGGHVDVVDPRSGARDDAQVGSGSEQIGGDLGRAAHHQGIGVSESVEELGRRTAASGIYLPAGLGAKQLQGRLRQLVGDYDFQDCPFAGPRVRM